MSLLNLLKRGGNDLIHPFGVGQPQQPQRIQTPAPAQVAPRPVVSTPAPSSNPFAHALGNIQHAGSNVLHIGGNTVNAVATGARDTGGAIAATSRFVHATPTDNKVAPFVGNAAKGIAEHLTVDPAIAAYDIGRGAVASATGNKVALANANIAKQNSGSKFISPVTRPLVQIARTIDHPFGGSSYQAKSPAAKEIFGTAPIQNIQAGVASNYAAHGNLPMPQRLALAGGYGAGQVAQDALTLAGGRKAAEQVSKSTVNTVKSGANLAHDVATRKPLPGVSDQQISAATRVQSHLQGFGESVSQVKPNDVATYRQIQKKLGVDVNDHKAVDDLIGARTTYQNRTPMQNIMRGNKLISLNSEGKGLVSQDGSSIPTLKKLAGRGNKAEVSPVPVSEKTGSSAGSIAPDMDVPSIKAYGKSIPLTKENGYEAVATKATDASGEPVSIYRKVQQTSTNIKGNNAKTSYWYDSNGTKLNDAQAKAAMGGDTTMAGANKPTAPVAKPMAVLPAKSHPTKALPTKPTVLKETPKLPGTGNRQTKFTQTVKASPEFSSETRKAVDSNYQTDTIDAAMNRAKGSIEKSGLAKTTDKTLRALNTERGTASRDTLAHAIELAKQHDALGTESGHNTAASLLNLAAEHGSAKGQGAQILAAIARRSPSGLRNKAITDLKNAGVKVTPEIQKEIQGHITALSTMKDGPAKDLAIAVFQKAVAKHLPQSSVDKAISIWKAGLLSGVKTQQGNAISNATFGGLKKISDVPATAADIGLKYAGKLPGASKLGMTGTRTKTLTGRGSLTGEGYKNGLFTMKTGIDKRSISDKYEQHAEINFGNKVLQTVLAKPANLIFRGMSAADQPFWYSALKNSLYDQAKADGINKGLRGQALLDHMNETVKNPTEKMADVATAEANKSTLNYDTVGSKAIQMAHKGIDMTPGITKAGSKIAHGVLNVLAPFVRVPSAFLSRTVDFTPLGVGKGLFHQVASGKFDQRALSQAIGEGITGTGVIALGVALTQHNMLSGDYPKNDQKEQQRWKAEGITPNSVKLGGKWVSLNYLGPAGLLFNAGNKLENAKGQGATTQVGTALGGLGQGLMGQSFLQGFSGFSDAIQDPNRNLKSFANSQASSIVPSIVNDAANVTDKFQRQANSVTDAIKNRLPGARETLAPKQDVYGNPLKQAAGPVGTINGLKPSNSLTGTSPAITEVNRLHGVNPNDTNLQVTPTPVGKSITIEGKNVPINDKQRYGLQKQVGQETQSKWNDLIKTPEYKAMDDTQKAAALNNIKGLATQDATRAYVVANNLGTYNKPADSKVVALNQGTNDIASLASSKATGGVTGMTLAKNLDQSNKQFLTKYNATSMADRKKAAYSQNNYDYLTAQAQYANDSANGSLSTAGNIKAKDALAKEKVGADFSKDTRDIYALSKPDIYDYITSDPNGSKIASDLKAYDQALKDAGISSSLKFKTGFNTAKKGSGGGSSKKPAAISYSGAFKHTSTKFKTSGLSTRGSLKSAGKVRLASYKVPKATTIKKPKLLRSA